MNILAIGGGDKRPALQAALDVLPDERVSVLIVPSACSTEAAYGRKVPATVALFETFGLRPNVLHAFGEQPSREQIADQLSTASLIHTIGGNTPHLLKSLRRWHMDTVLTSVLRGGTLHTGISAGALLPFDLIHSNPSAQPERDDWDFTLLQGLGLLACAATAHANKHDPSPQGLRVDSRLDHLQAHLPSGITFGIGIDEGSALLLGEQPAIISNHADGVHILQRQADHISRTAIGHPSELPDLFRPK